MATRENQSPTRDLVEFCVGYALILAAIWTLNPWQRWFYWIAITWIVVTTWMRRPTWKALGLGLPGSGPVAMGGGRCSHTRGPGRLHGEPAALAAPAPRSYAAALACLGIPDMGGHAAVFAADLFPASLACDYCRVRWRPVVAAAGLFSLAHLPNPVLTPVTLVWGIAACMLFLRYRNIYSPGPRPRNPRALCRSDCARFDPTPYAGGDRLLPLSSSSQPDSPDRIHRRMGDGRRPTRRS